MARLPTEADAYLLLESLRWNGSPVCPHCGSEAEHFPIVWVCAEDEYDTEAPTEIPWPSDALKVLSAS